MRYFYLAVIFLVRFSTCSFTSFYPNISSDLYDFLYKDSQITKPIKKYDSLLLDRIRQQLIYRVLGHFDGLEKDRLEKKIRFKLRHLYNHVEGLNTNTLELKCLFEPNELRDFNSFIVKLDRLGPFSRVKANCLMVNAINFLDYCEIRLLIDEKCSLKNLCIIIDIVLSRCKKIPRGEMLDHYCEIFVNKSLEILLEIVSIWPNDGNLFRQNTFYQLIISLFKYEVLVYLKNHQDLVNDELFIHDPLNNLLMIKFQDQIVSLSDNLDKNLITKAL